MSHTNLELVRLLVGDRGVPAREVSSGDGVTVEYYLGAPPIVGNSQQIWVGGSLYTEVASAPGATEYTLDDRTGRLVFGTAPVSATDNVLATYLAAEIPDADFTAALEAQGLTAATVADTGPSATLLAAASLAARFMAARAASLPASVSVDGQTITRRGPEEWAELATELTTATSTTARSLLSAAVIRVDGYNDTDASTRDIDALAANPRRRYYGQEDRIP